MATGTVKFFNAERGFGFISREQGDDLFVHISQVTSNTNPALEVGQQVSYEIGQSRRGGDEAQRVTTL